MPEILALMEAASNSREITRLRTSAATLASIFNGQTRFSDALIPTQKNLEPIYMVENWLFKMAIINWLSRLIRTAQLAKPHGPLVNKDLFGNHYQRP